MTGQIHILCSYLSVKFISCITIDWLNSYPIQLFFGQSISYMDTSIHTQRKKLSTPDILKHNKLH
jgi:hypothetical protein